MASRVVIGDANGGETTTSTVLASGVVPDGAWLRANQNSNPQTAR